MNTYYWPEVDTALGDYTLGQIIVVADSVEQAIQLVVEHPRGDDIECFGPGWLATEYGEKLAAELRSKTPIVTTGAVAYLVRGSS